VDKTVYATFSFADRLRHQMPFLVEQLQRNGLETHLISGDADPTTQSVAAAIGISLARGGLLPMDKADYIQQLQRKGKKVVMIGDGVNDAPAMARADLALAIHSGAHLSGQVADVLLMRGDPLQLLDWLFWSKKVNAKVFQNLGWAWAYNLIAIPMAMAGGLTPIVAVAAMLLSSLTVIGNTLCLTPSPRRTGKVAP
jgi:P-type E1-E2 ATPase